MDSGLTKSRIEALCDGVFAIAMTLMAFNVKVPSRSGGSGAVSLAAALFELWPQFLTYIISFVILGVYWIGHHNQFHYIRRSDRVLLWINIIFLMFLTAIPFSTGVLGEYPNDQIAVVVYGSNLLLVGLLLYCQWWYATSKHHLTDPGLDPAIVTMAKKRILIGPCILLLAIAVSYLNTKFSILIFAVLPVIYIIPGRIDQHWSPRE